MILNVIIDRLIQTGLSEEEAIILLANLYEEEFVPLYKLKEEGITFMGDDLLH